MTEVRISFSAVDNDEEWDKISDFISHFKNVRYIHNGKVVSPEEIDVVRNQDSFEIAYDIDNNGKFHLSRIWKDIPLISLISSIKINDEEQILRYRVEFDKPIPQVKRYYDKLRDNGHIYSLGYKFGEGGCITGFEFVAWNRDDFDQCHFKVLTGDKTIRESMTMYSINDVDMMMSFRLLFDFNATPYESQCLLPIFNPLYLGSYIYDLRYKFVCDGESKKFNIEFSVFDMNTKQDNYNHVYEIVDGNIYIQGHLISMKVNGEEHMGWEEERSNTPTIQSVDSGMEPPPNKLCLKPKCPDVFGIPPLQL